MTARSAPTAPASSSRVKNALARRRTVGSVDPPAQRLLRSDVIPLARAGFEADREARYAGRPPGMIPVSAERPGDPCALPTDDTRRFFHETCKTLAPTWRNEVTLQSVELFMEYEPGAYVRDVCPTPLLIVVALEDTLTPAEFACEAFERALHPKKLVTLPGGHFGAYVGRNFEISSASQRDWFVEHLRP